MQPNRNIRSWTVITAVVLTMSAMGSHAGAWDIGTISEVQANRIGLSVQWTTQVEATNMDDIVALVLAVDEDDATTFFEITGGRIREVVSQRDVLPNGRTFGTGSEGLAKAREYAELRREMLQIELKARDIDDPVTIQEITLPRTTLYVASRTGAVQAFDAESGKQLWRASVGEHGLSVYGLAASSQYVAAVAGSTVYCLDAKTGKVLWQQRCSHAVTGNPTFSENYVFVPLWDGHLQAFPLSNAGRGY
ncbi:MAG TPA: PQQ-binding-like beta-propeller repeat protein, partial [Pirellulaceae bacterium]|nr:PQQ-binding-like beta-propeller repeat protein [Pirellulaceae bacterium]